MVTTWDRWWRVRHNWVTKQHRDGWRTDRWKYTHTAVYMHAYTLSHFTCVWLCDPMEYSPPGSSVHGILQARILEWVAFSSSRGSTRPRDGTHVSYISCTGRQILSHLRHLESPGIDSFSAETTDSQRFWNFLKVMDLMNDRSHDFGHGIAPLWALGNPSEKMRIITSATRSWWNIVYQTTLGSGSKLQLITGCWDKPDPTDYPESSSHTWALEELESSDLPSTV